MDIRIHTGVHRTASQHLQKTLVENQELLESEGICVPEKNKAAKALMSAMKQLKDGAELDHVNADLLYNLTDGQEFRRVVISHQDLCGPKNRSFGKALLYPRVGEATRRLTEVLDGMDCRMFVSVRNPASYLPSIFADNVRWSDNQTFDEFLGDANVTALKWSSFLHRIQDKGNGVPLTVWRYEDYPFIWRQVVGALTGISNPQILTGSIDPVSQGISMKGSKLLRKYLDKTPPQNAKEFQKIIAVFCDKFPTDPHSHIATEWPNDLCEGLTDNYSDDWYYIERMDNLEMIQHGIYT